MAFTDKIRGFFRRIVQIVTGPPEEPKKEPPSEPPEPPPIGGPGERTDEYDFRLRETWEDITNAPLFQMYDWLELWRDTGVELIEDDEDTLVQWWEDFLRSHYLVSSEFGSMSRNDYYNEVGLGRNRVDWEQFKDIKRGTP